MDTEERLKWLETRIATSMRPRADELKLLFSRDESRATLIEFLSNDEARRLFVFNKLDDRGGTLKVSLHAPKQVCGSSIYSRYYAEACNEWRDPSPRPNAWATRSDGRMV